jgi:hypothetical protein
VKKKLRFTFYSTISILFFLFFIGIQKHKVSSPQIQITETSVQTDLESRPHVENESPGSGPLSDIGDSSSSNTDWERMGAESGSQTIEAFDDAILKCSKVFFIRNSL